MNINFTEVDTQDFMLLLEALGRNKAEEKSRDKSFIEIVDNDGGSVDLGDGEWWVKQKGCDWSQWFGPCSLANIEYYFKLPKDNWTP